MIEKARLHAITTQVVQTRKIQQASLKKLYEIKLNSGASMQPTQLKEINKAIKELEKALKLPTCL